MRKTAKSRAQVSRPPMDPVWDGKVGAIFACAGAERIRRLKQGDVIDERTAFLLRYATPRDLPREKLHACRVRTLASIALALRLAGVTAVVPTIQRIAACIDRGQKPAPAAFPDLHPDRLAEVTARLADMRDWAPRDRRDQWLPGRSHLFKVCAE